MVFGVEQTCPVDVLQSESVGLFTDVVGLTDQDNVGHSVGYEPIGGHQCALFRAFGQDDALLVRFCAIYDTLNQIHGSVNYYE